jgi:hypothetical protein
VPPDLCRHTALQRRRRPRPRPVQCRSTDVGRPPSPIQCRSTNVACALPEAWSLTLPTPYGLASPSWPSRRLAWLAQPPVHPRLAHHWYDGRRDSVSRGGARPPVGTRQSAGHANPWCGGCQEAEVASWTAESPRPTAKARVGVDVALRAAALQRRWRTNGVFFFKKRKGKFVWTLEQGNVGLRVALALMFLGPRRLTRRGGVRAG